MPSYDEHCKQSFERYGITGEEIHEWMDEPCKIYGSAHRKVRHDPNQQLPAFLIHRYGADLARNIMIDHVLLDTSTKTGDSLLFKESESISQISKNMKKDDLAELFKEIEQICAELEKEREQREKEEAKKQYWRNRYQELIEKEYLWNYNWWLEHTNLEWMQSMEDMDSFYDWAEKSVFEAIKKDDFSQLNHVKEHDWVFETTHTTSYIEEIKENQGLTRQERARRKIRTGVPYDIVNGKIIIKEEAPA